jgi:hypothetical protein
MDLDEGNSGKVTSQIKVRYLSTGQVAKPLKRKRAKASLHRFF